jgi:hypothetical protein
VYLVSPTDPLYVELGTKFIALQAQVFGTDHIYNCDTYNEMVPPTNDPKYLADASAAVYNGMAKADPDAIWLMQGWLFFSASCKFHIAGRVMLCCVVLCCGVGVLCCVVSCRVVLCRVALRCCVERVQHRLQVVTRVWSLPRRLAILCSSGQNLLAATANRSVSGCGAVGKDVAARSLRRLGSSLVTNCFVLRSPLYLVHSPQLRRPARDHWQLASCSFRVRCQHHLARGFAIYS